MRQKQKEKIEFEELPELSQLEAELKREQYRHRYGRTLRSTIFVLIVVAAAAVLAATIWLPVFRKVSLLCQFIVLIAFSKDVHTDI